MQFYKFPEKKACRPLFALFFLAILMLTRDTLSGRCLIGFYPSQAITAGLFLILFIAFLIYNRRNLPEILKDPRMLLALTAAGVMLIPMVLKRDWQMMYVSILFYLLICVFTGFFLDLRTAARYYVTVLSVLGVYSFFCAYIFRILPDRGILQVPIFTNSRDVEFYNFIFSYVPLEYVKKRNFGIFREPGVYQFFSLLGLYLNNYRAQWEKNLQTWTVNVILIVTMLSTFATGGVIELGLLGIFMFFDKKWYQQRGARLAALGLILLGFAGGAWILITKNSLYEEFYGMITKFSSEESSGSRFGAIYLDAVMFLKHPLFGDRVKTVFEAVPDNTTTTMILFAFLGIPGGLFHVLSWTALCWDRKRCIPGNLILIVILFMSFNTQNLSWNPVFWLFPILALAERGIPAVSGGLRKRSVNGH